MLTSLEIRKLDKMLDGALEMLEVYKYSVVVKGIAVFFYAIAILVGWYLFNDAVEVVGVTQQEADLVALSQTIFVAIFLYISQSLYKTFIRVRKLKLYISGIINGLIAIKKLESKKL